MLMFVRPLAAALFADDGGGSLDNHRAFTVEYDASTDCNRGGSGSNAGGASARDTA